MFEYNYHRILGIAIFCLIPFSIPAFAAPDQQNGRPDTSLFAAIPGYLDGSISMSASSFRQRDDNFGDSVEIQILTSLQHTIGIGPSGNLSWVTIFDIDSNKDISRQGATGTDLSFLTGPQFITSDTGYLRSIIPYFEGEWARANTHTLYQSLGAGVVSSGFLGQNENIEWYVDADVLSRQYNTSTLTPFADEQNGPNFHIEAEITLSGNQNTSLIMKAEFERQWAREKFQSYLDAGAAITVAHSFQSPFRADEYWSLDISGTSQYRRYDIPDPFTYPDQRDKSTELSVSATLNIPVSNALSAFTTLTQYWGKSSLPGNSYSRTDIEAGFSYSF
jgi:hypothetical protein